MQTIKTLGLTLGLLALILASIFLHWGIVVTVIIMAVATLTLICATQHRDKAD